MSPDFLPGLTARGLVTIRLMGFAQIITRRQMCGVLCVCVCENPEKGSKISTIFSEQRFSSI